MKRYKPAADAPELRTVDGEAFPDAGKMIDPANRYYARLIMEGALVEAPEDHTETAKPAASAASRKGTRK